MELKAKVEDLNSKVDFVLNARQTDGHHKEPLGNNRQLSGNRRKQMETEEPPFIIERNCHFATEGGGIKVYSDISHDIRTVVSSTEDIEGIAYDPVHDKIYFCSWETIYGTNPQGNEVEIVFHDDNAEYVNVFALAVDWITGNLYGGSSNSGKLFVCNTVTSLPFNCTTILQSTEGLYGIAVSPNEGQMYWTDLGGSIIKAEMDGSNPLQLIGGLQRPTGIALDYGSSRLFWADYHGHRIQSSTLGGEDVRTVVQLSETLYPWGVAVQRNKVYWGSREPQGPIS